MSSISKAQLHAIADKLFDSYLSIREAYHDVLNTDIDPGETAILNLEKRLKDECDLIECKDCGLWIELVEVDNNGGQIIKEPEQHSCPKTVSLDSTCNTTIETLQLENTRSAPQS